MDNSDLTVIFPDEEPNSAPNIRETERNRFHLAKHAMPYLIVPYVVLALVAIIVEPEMIDEVWRDTSNLVLFVMGAIIGHYFKSR